MNDRTKRLHQLMKDHRLTAADVGSILKRKPLTVWIWRCKDERRTIPENELKLLEAEIAKRKAAV